MINSHETNAKMIKHLKEMEKEEVGIYYISFTCGGKISTSPGHFAKSSSLSFV